MKHHNSSKINLGNTIVNFIELDDMRLFINDFAQSHGMVPRAKKRNNYSKSKFYIGRYKVYFEFYYIKVGGKNITKFTKALKERYKEYTVKTQHHLCEDYVSIKLFIKGDE